MYNQVFGHCNDFSFSVYFCQAVRNADERDETGLFSAEKEVAEMGSHQAKQQSQ